MKLNPDRAKSPEQLAWENGYGQGFANAKAMCDHKAAQPLTDGQIVAAANEAFDTTIDLDDETLVNKYGHGIYISRYLDFARAIEAAHGIGATTGKEPGNA